MDPLATVAQLETRLRMEVGTLTGAELALAEATLADTSAMVRRACGYPLVLDPTATEYDPPSEVVSVVLDVAVRRFNYDPSGVTSFVVGEYSERRRYGAQTLTVDERRMVREAVGVWSGVGSVATFGPYGTETAYVTDGFDESSVLP